MTSDPVDPSEIPPSENGFPPAGAEPPRAVVRRSGGCLRFVGGLVLGLTVALVAIVLWNRGSALPRLTREAYEHAGRQWDSQGPKNYNLDIDVTGNRPSRIHVEVRGGQAVHCVRDGVEPRQERTWYYWTVPGMFDTIGLELDKIDDPQTGFGATAGVSVVLRAEFDEQFGYPRRYQRVVSGQALDMGWTITQFEVVEGSASTEK